MNNKKPPFHDLKNFLKQYNIFTASERKGIVALSVALLLLMAVLVALKFYEPEEKADFSELDKAVKHFEELKRADSIALHAEKENTDTIHYPKVVEMFRFNPNTLPDSLWHVMGISDKQLSVIRKYQANGGTFRTRADFKKLYVISDEQKERMWPYIDLPDSISYTRDKKEVKKPEQIKKEIKSILMNAALAEDWDLLPYIGEGRAAAIVSYRERLGGFLSTEQLLEVNIINDTILNAIKPYLILDVSRVRKMNINTGNAYDLRHPYLEPSLAKVIVNYRKMHGDYKSVDDIKKLGVMRNDDFERLRPYLKVE